MFETEFVRDLLFTAGLFGFVTFVWSGWAQEGPPSTAARIYLGGMSVIGAAVAGIGLYNGIMIWGSGSSMVFGEASFTTYLVMCVLELVAAGVAAIILKRRDQMKWFAPTLLLIVGIHFAPMGWVFQLPVMYVVTGLIIIAALAAFKLPHEKNEPSFWCGALAAPIFLAAAVPSLVIGLSRLSEVA
ncbi:hypothetical protein [Microlunatus sp. Y2014]|uniref:hypothetical protein n=1 Tax=Microlunatus sp. Y2014 TaxID=3418488 RepID=UPI003DA711BB